MIVNGRPSQAQVWFPHDRRPIRKTLLHRHRRSRLAPGKPSRTSPRPAPRPFPNNTRASRPRLASRRRGRRHPHPLPRAGVAVTAFAAARASGRPRLRGGAFAGDLHSWSEHPSAFAGMTSSIAGPSASRSTECAIECAIDCRATEPLNRAIRPTRPRRKELPGQRRTPLSEPVSALEAEGEGFEPSTDVTARNGFRDRRIRPLCHPSAVVLA